MTLTIREAAARLSCSVHVKSAVLAALFLTACTTPTHTPERDGVWITKPREMVRCWETKEGVVCRSDRVIQAESLGH